MKDINIFEFQEKYKTEEERVEALKHFTEDEVKALIDSCSIVQAKIYYSNLYTKSQGLKRDSSYNVNR